ncbi:Crp/Fnr family transcriptional regulator [Echinicola sp. 20G]|uniref:Crp/Fnr family transcriptional regulator n=1 Tax=Echinicola sp. 20G TaxID=2781961 RepID=UPI00190FCB61|nr:Crp/Fnr family transcriptional regulator [Echinicola sp. 20G]
MKEALEQVLISYGELSKDNINRGLDFFTPKFYKKGDFLIKAGKNCDWIAFVCSGIVRNYCISSKDEEVTYCITFPNKFITAYSSFISDQQTFENIHAMTDTEVLIIEKRKFRELINTSNQWLKFSNYFTEQTYILMESRLLALQIESAEKRYTDLVSNNPEFVQQVPLKYIASYLGITQRHLSRLRSVM